MSNNTELIYEETVVNKTKKSKKKGSLIQSSLSYLEASFFQLFLSLFGRQPEFTDLCQKRCCQGQAKSLWPSLIY